MRDSDNATYEYIRKEFLPSKDLEPVLAAMAAVNKQGMSIHAAEAKILQFLIRTFSVKTVVEIGCFMGYSAIQMARALPKEGKLISLENNSDYHAKAKEHVEAFPTEASIEILLGEAKDTLVNLKGPFDLVFIDADKGAYCNYLDWAEENVKKGGLIIGDNTLLFGHVVHDAKPKEVSLRRWEVMREFNRRLSDSNRYVSMMLPTLEGLTIGQKLF